MIWICTLFLLVVAAWLFFNAVNERRWVQAHSHDETVASDEGLLSGFTVRTGTGQHGGAEGKVSIDQENSRFAKAVNKVQEKTSKYGEKFFESKAAAARIDDPEQRPRSAREENTLFGRAVARVGEKTEKMGEKLELKVKAASSERTGSPQTSNESLFDRTAKKVSAKSDEVSQRVASGARNLVAQNRSGEGIAGKGSALFSSVSDKVSGGMEKFESKLETRIGKAREAGDDGKDLMSRVASKVGNKINELDDKYVKTGKKNPD